MIDKNYVLSDEQTVAMAAGNVDSTNVIDLGEDWKPGETPRAQIEIDCSEALAATGAATLQIKLMDSANNSTWRDIFLTPAFAKASIAPAAGGKHLLTIPLPGGALGCQRYVKLNYIVAVDTTTAGKLTAVLQPQAV